MDDGGGTTITTATSTTNSFKVIAPNLITASACILEVTDTLTAASVNTLLHVSYQKSGVTGASSTNRTIGLRVNMADSATNNASGAVTMIGAKIDVDSASATGIITQTGLILNVAADETGDSILTKGIDMTVMDGGVDFINRSTADEEDYFFIKTAAAGATTIGTLDSDDGEEAHLTFQIQGDTIFQGAIADGTLTEVLRIDASTSSVGIGVNDPDSLLEIFGTSAQLKLSYDASNYTAITVADDGHLELATTGTDADLTLDSASAIMLEATNIYLYGTSSSSSSFHFLSGSGTDPKLTIRSDDDGGDQLVIEVLEHGATTISTVDDDAAAAHLNIEVDGHVEFDNCAVGFDKLAGTFGTSGVIGDGNDSTDIDFRLGNKYELELTNNLSGSFEFLNLIFPNTSGNFLLVISQDGTGSRTVGSAAWVVYQSDGSTKATNAAFADGTDGAIRWAGGSAPTLTTTADKADIISIYWDADNQTAFAVASLDF